MFCQVCGLCPPGWALIARGCSACPSEGKLSTIRTATIAIFVVLCVFIWYVLSWNPLFSARISLDLANSITEDKVGNIENIVTTIAQKIQHGISPVQSLLKKVKNIRDFLLQNLGNLQPQGPQSEGITKEKTIQYLKLKISYFQVVSSFLTFNVNWPELLRSCMLWIKGTLFLDVLQLPGLSCLWIGINFKKRLLTYTLGPLVVSAFLVMPCMFGWLAGYRERKPAQWEAAADAAWKNIMFWVFLVYPVVSLTTLQAFDCQPSGLGLLAADRNFQCPSNSDFWG